MGYTPTTAGSAPASGSTALANGPFLVPTDAGVAGVGPEPRAAQMDPDFRGVPFNTQQPPTLQSSDQLLAKLYQMDQPTLANLQLQLKLAGYGNVASTGIVDSNTLDAYTALLTDTARYAAAGNRQFGDIYTPDTLLQAKVAANNSAKADSGSALTDPLVAQKLVDDSLDSHLGRKANAKERAAFQAQLAAYSANPNATETGAAQLASNWAMADQGRANEAGALTESRFIDVLHNLMSSG